MRHEALGVSNKDINLDRKWDMAYIQWCIIISHLTNYKILFFNGKETKGPRQSLVTTTSFHN